jgi:hypothetical protein
MQGRLLSTPNGSRISQSARSRVIPGTSLQLLFNPHLRMGIGTEILRNAPDSTSESHQKDRRREENRQGKHHFDVHVMKQYKQKNGETRKHPYVCRVFVCPHKSAWSVIS